MPSQVVFGAPEGASHALADVTVLAPALIKLLDDASNAMEHDPVMARSCLAQALGELKTFAISAGAGLSPPPRCGGIAPWHEHRVTAHIEGSFDGPIPRGAFDALHLHVQKTIVAGFANSECCLIKTTSSISDHPVVDPVIEPSARYSRPTEELSGMIGQSHAYHISLAGIARLCGVNSNPPPTNLPRALGLAKWRLKRATEYVTANLAEPIGLADIATAAGLSRMHFAAQFRLATGLRPHEYLLHRRIERSQDLLLRSRLSLVEIAFDVGFKTQAHFTTVFARLVGETPNVWRQRNRTASELSRSKAVS